MYVCVTAGLYVYHRLIDRYIKVWNILVKLSFMSMTAPKPELPKGPMQSDYDSSN